MKAIWLTDIHLDFLDETALEEFLIRLHGQHADALLISGDIAEGPSVGRHLTRMADSLRIPIYFVLGNHDYYNGSIARVRQWIRALTAESPLLHWLSDSPPIRLSSRISLVGHDGWGDARFGDYARSTVSLNDFFLIEELAGLSRMERRRKLEALGDEAAAHLRSVLPRALRTAEHVVVVTHVPPFREAAWYGGRPSDTQWLPYFSCKAAGDVLRMAMQQNPGKSVTVLCGHTHGGGRSRILPNLLALTGPARYGFPEVQQIFEWD